MTHIICKKGAKGVKVGILLILGIAFINTYNKPEAGIRRLTTFAAFTPFL